MTYSKYNLIDGQKSVPLNQLPSEAWTNVSGPDDYTGSRQTKATKSYKLLGVANRCIAIRANTLASMPWSISNTSGTNLYSTDDQLLPENLDFLQQFKRKLYLTEASLSIFARSYLYLQWPIINHTDIRWLMPTSVDPIWDLETGLVGFRRYLNKEDKRDFEPNDFCFFTIPNATHETAFAPSPLATAADSANVMINLNAFANQFIERGAVKATIISVDPTMPKAERQILKTWWQNVMSGMKNAWSNNIVSNAVTPTVIGEGLAEVADIEITRGKAEEVAIALGVPFSVLFSNAANHATAITDQRNFYNYTIVPEADFIAEELNEKIFKQLGLIFAFETEAIPVFQDSEKERAETFKTYVDSGMKPSIAAQIAGIKLPPQTEFDSLDEMYNKTQDSLDNLSQNQNKGPGNNDGANQPNDTTNNQNESTGALNQATSQSDNAVKESNQFRRWVKKRIKDTSTKQWTLDDFEAKHIDSAIKRQIVAELLKEQLDNDEDLDNEETESFHFGLKEKLPIEIADSSNGNPITTDVEVKAAKAIKKGLQEQKRAVLMGNEENLNRGTNEINMAMLLTGPTRVIDHSITASDALRRAMLDSAMLGTDTAIRGLAGIGIGFNYELVNENAQIWANTASAEFITAINATTVRQTQIAISQWIENGEPLSQLVRELEPIFGTTRAELIASTEVTRSFAEGNRIAYRESQVVEKIKWKTAFDELVCPICGPLHNKEADLEQGFRDYGFPPAHPRCRCWIVPVIDIPKIQVPESGVLKPVKPKSNKPTGQKLFDFSALDNPEPGTEEIAARLKQAISELDAFFEYTGDKLKFSAEKVSRFTKNKNTQGEYSSQNNLVYLYEGTKKEGQLIATAYHEFGHAVDYQMINAAGNKTAESASTTNILMDRLFNSKAYNKLTQAKEAMIQQQKELKALGLSTSGHKNMIDWYDYAQSDKELVARSFAQYAANKTGNKEALKYFKKEAKDGRQWSDSDFKEIFNAYEKIFQKKGVLR